MPISIDFDACAVAGTSRAATAMRRARNRIATMLGGDPADLVGQVRAEGLREAGRDVREVLIGEDAADHGEAVLLVAEVAAEVDRRPLDLVGGLDRGVRRERVLARCGTRRAGPLAGRDRPLDAREGVLS